MVSDTPEEMWEQACAYFEWSDNNPLSVPRTMNAGFMAGKELKEKMIRPYSMKAFCLHCGISEDYVRDLLNMKDSNSLYYMVIERIKMIIHIQNTELATVGVYNPAFVAKLLESDLNNRPIEKLTIEVVHGLPELSNSEMEILEKVNLEKGMKKDSEE